ncbi:MAG: bifunctional riboflavin kinase/FAD synthetase [Chloroflexi bacterium]|nr:MAG: bifunctional riboflavin kinase/FAD synthetase [Chloroflexota bacterium]
MQHYRSLEAVTLTGSWLTIGVFDGVHRGHQEIIRQLTAGAHATGAPAVLLTFSPHPAVVLGGADLKYLTTPNERAEIMAQLGVDVVITHPFDETVAALSAEEFMARLEKALGLKKLLIGHDFALGRNRAGNFSRLTEIGREMGYDVLPISAIRFADRVISSSLIRKEIAEGEVAAAALQLGRYYALSGLVIPGDGRGRTIGIPTANVDVPPTKAVPANGVYACWASVGRERYKAVINIGLRPTFTTGEVLPRIEAHLIGYSADLYGQTVKLEFIERLRGEQKFPSVEALVAQIRADIAKAEEIL